MALKTFPGRLEILQILAEHPVVRMSQIKAERIFVVGSYARDDERDDSDIDIVIEAGHHADELQQAYRRPLQDHFMRHDLQGRHDDVHPQWNGQRLDVVFVQHDLDANRPRVALDDAPTLQDAKAWRFPLHRSAFTTWFRTSPTVDADGFPIAFYPAASGAPEALTTRPRIATWPMAHEPRFVSLPGMRSLAAAEQSAADGGVAAEHAGATLRRDGDDLLIKVRRPENVRLARDVIDPEQRAWTREELELLPVPLLDLMAFNLRSDTLVEIDPGLISEPEESEIINARHALQMGGLAWAQSVSFDEPVDVRLTGANRFALRDGHHRYVAALALGTSLPARITIEVNSISQILSEQATSVPRAKLAAGGPRM